VKKLSTVRKSESKIFKEHQLTIGLDRGDRSSCYCVLEDRGEVIREASVSTNKKIWELAKRYPACNDRFRHADIRY
jgi:activator of 2-hydroxyglutaryl-CoA dehydratase